MGSAGASGLMGRTVFMGMAGVLGGFAGRAGVLGKMSEAGLPEAGEDAEEVSSAAAAAMVGVADDDQVPTVLEASVSGSTSIAANSPRGRPGKATGTASGREPETRRF